MAEELSDVDDLALGCNGVSTWFDRQGFEVHLSWKDKTELPGVVDLTRQRAGGYLEVILELFARLHAVQEAHGWQQTNFYSVRTLYSDNATVNSGHISGLRELMNEEREECWQALPQATRGTFKALIFKGCDDYIAALILNHFDQALVHQENAR